VLTCAIAPDTIKALTAAEIMSFLSIAASTSIYCSKENRSLHWSLDNSRAHGAFPSLGNAARTDIAQRNPSGWRGAAKPRHSSRGLFVAPDFNAPCDVPVGWSHFAAGRSAPEACLSTFP
jgi:hypothetical protein